MSLVQYGTLRGILGMGRKKVINSLLAFPPKIIIIMIIIIIIIIIENKKIKIEC